MVSRPAPLAGNNDNSAPLFPLPLRPPVATPQVEDDLYASVKDAIVRKKGEVMAQAQVFSKPKKFRR